MVWPTLSHPASWEAVEGAGTPQPLPPEVSHGFQEDEPGEAFSCCFPETGAHSLLSCFRLRKPCRSPVRPGFRRGANYLSHRRQRLRKGSQHSSFS